MKSKIKNLEIEQTCLQKSNKKLRRDLSSLSKGSQLTEELINRAQRYRKERNLLVDEVERLRDKLEDMKMMVSKMKLDKEHQQKSQQKMNVVKLSRVEAFAPTTVDQLREGMMVKFIGVPKSSDISPVQEGQIEEILKIDGEHLIVIRMGDEDGDTLFCQIPMKKIIVAWS